MKNKIRFLIPIILLAFVFVPKVFAGVYDCSVAYPGADSTDPFTYDACCYPQGGDTEPYQGISCRPEGEILQKAGNNPTTCVSRQSILDLATNTRDRDRIGFNCFTGTVSGTCRDGYCKPSGSNICQQQTGVSCPLELNRQNICPGGCGGCDEGYVYCVNDQPAFLADESNPVVGVTPACQLEKDGSTYAPNGGVSCADMGREVLNPCTGECTDCPEGRTLSGRTPGLCVTFGQRFIEIFADGFTSLGGKELTYAGADLAHTYSYGSITDEVDWSDFTDPAFYGSVFAGVDFSDHLNWASPTVPAPLQDLITNNNYQFCADDGDCPAGSYCLAGICYDPTANAGDACTTSSDCPLGMVCDPSGVCALPDGNTDNVVYAGQTAPFDGAQGGYVNVDNLCNGVVTGSHVCTAAEVILSYALGVSVPNSGSVWINNGPPGYVKYVTNDCNGWQTNASTIFGSIWNFSSDASFVTPCNLSRAFACCK